MRASSVDPRYANHIEDSPAYRVDFWDANENSDEWRIEAARNIDEVMSWAAENASGRSYVVYSEVENEAGVALARLFGTEPGNVAADS